MRGLICDDHPLMREALAGAMRDRWPGLVLDEAADYPQAWAHADAGPDFCLVDLDMPGAQPIAGLAELKARAPNAVLLVLTGLTDEALLAHALPALRSLEAARLPPRQQEVLGLLAEGLTNKEIARRLDISPATVKIHVARVTSWLGAANRTDAVARAQRGRII
jgi:two-component system nitrate/nitrite response regulator NarL